MIINIIFIITTIVYVVIITWLITGWLKLPYFINDADNTYSKFSIIIPARNEMNNINYCLKSLLNQQYPKQNFEVIIVDDHSIDKSTNIVNKFIEDNNAENFRLISLSEKETGKKSAIIAGVKAAKYDYIITTDADCQMNPAWIKTINDFICSTMPEMIVMPVIAMQEKSFFQKLQSLEFLSLAGTTGATAGWGYHIMCNGANLCFTKNGFMKVGGYNDNLQHASGDDVFLLQKMIKAFPEQIKYLKNRNAIVKTKTSPDIKEFFNQRKRWISKSKAYKDKLTLFIGSVIGVFNMLLVISLILFAIYGSGTWLWPWLIKIVIDFPFLLVTSLFFNKKMLLLFYPIASILYPFYVTISLLLGFKGNYSWKGRSYFK